MNKYVTLVLLCLLLAVNAWSQHDFDFNAYQNYLSSHADLTPEGLKSEFPLLNTYIIDPAGHSPVASAAFMDSVMEKYDLTADELELLQENHFMVTERYSFSSVGHALHDVYSKDLPVFLSSDAVLQALHSSYDRILMDLEIQLLQPRLNEMLQDMYDQLPTFKTMITPELSDAIADADLYVTMALSLLRQEKLPTQTGLVDNFDEVWNAIEGEQAVTLPLFAERGRHIDFSQFTPRGHYTKQYWDNTGEKTLENYFKAMMWLGRIEIWLTPPPENPFEAKWEWWEIQRMAQAVLLINNLMDDANVWPLMTEIDDIITFFVGESDNLTPWQLNDVMDESGITLESIADSAGLADFQAILTSSDEYSQKILSALIMMDPYSDEPGVLPVAYKVMGQRFIIDSYVLGNVVYDRIVYNGAKVWRPLPDPLDAMFVLGNDNAQYLVQDELAKYYYGQNLAALRYLVGSYDDNFWDATLYNTWLSAIRALNPVQDLAYYPGFMQSAGWQHKELNTQLASWAQLRHDNLLYAKQSYTGMTGCSYPHSFIEPYPELYATVSSFAQKAINFFSAYPQDSNIMSNIVDYYTRLQSITDKLEALAEKELAGEAFTEQDTTFLHDMLFMGGGSGAPPYTGWYADMYYEREDAALMDHVIADVHTQPTDQSGAPVGHVLHVGVGKFNLGFFVAESPSNGYGPMIYVGPVMSYYEKVTNDFERLTDDDWKDDVEHDLVPERPEWVYVYMADANGERKTQGHVLPVEIVNSVNDAPGSVPVTLSLANNYPNPFNPVTSINFTLPAAGHVELAVYDITGRLVTELVSGHMAAGHHQAVWDAGNMASGVYFYQLRSGSQQIIKKMTLVK